MKSLWNGSLCTRLLWKRSLFCLCGTCFAMKVIHCFFFVKPLTFFLFCLLHYGSKSICLWSTITYDSKALILWSTITYDSKALILPFLYLEDIMFCSLPFCHDYGHANCRIATEAKPTLRPCSHNDSRCFEWQQINTSSSSLSSAPCT